MALATCSKIFADVPLVVHARLLSCDLLGKFAENCKMCIVHAGSAGTETSKCAGRNESVPSLRYCLCWGVDTIALVVRVYEQRPAEAKSLRDGGARLK